MTLVRLITDYSVPLFSRVCLNHTVASESVMILFRKTVSVIVRPEPAQFIPAEDELLLDSNKQSEIVSLGCSDESL